ncbi:orexin receptor type 2 [Elysia marginata]|uniref:Orexin receptor type 2 n=1 Tax=Elysia marginata TaxID=1093978 RepID=A0AAV4IAF7_9GAST|nr:orexin receptor type 2 [Elysia marginata]
MTGMFAYFAIGGTLLAGMGASTKPANTQVYNVYDENSDNSSNRDTRLCCLDLQRSSCFDCASDFNSSGVYGNGSGVEPGLGQPDSSHPNLGPPLYMYIYVTFINVLVMLVGITGNVLVIQVVARTKSMRRRMNYFLISLSAADLTVLVVCQPIALLEFYGKERWFIGEAMCKIVPFLENMSHHCSVLTLLVIGFERYHAICHPLKETTGRRFLSVSLVVPVVWTVSIIVSLPFAIISNIEETTYYDNSIVDVCRTNMKSKLARAYIIFIFTVFLVLPLLLLTAMYTAIILTLAVNTIPGASCNGNGNGASKRYSSTMSVNTVGSVGGQSASGRHHVGQDHEMVRHARVMSSRRQVVRMMVAVMALYFCCLMPMRCVQLWVVFGPEGDIEKLGFEGYLNLIYCVRILIMINSAGNPIIYGLLSSNFRSAFHESLCCCRGNEQSHGMRYNTTYYSNSHFHHHNLHHASQGSPMSTRVARASAWNKNTRQLINSSPRDTGHGSLPLKYMKKDYCIDHADQTGATTREPLLVSAQTVCINQTLGVQNNLAGSKAEFV